VGRRPRSGSLSPAAEPLVPSPLVPNGLDATLVLLRHGETDYIVEGRFQGQAEATLTDLGRRQARLAGERLTRPDRSPALPVPPSRPTAIVHSPLGRTAETAALVAAAMRTDPDRGQPPIPRPDAGFAEIGQGEWEGLRHDEIVDRYGEVLAGWRRRPTETWAPGGESPMAVRARLRPSLATLLAELGTGRPPGTLDRSQVPGYRGTVLAPDRPWALVVGHDGLFKVLLLTILDLPIERFWSFTMALCGLSVVELRGGRPVVVAHNLTDHLAVLEADEARAEAEADERSRTGAL
jgi:probable phosphoglycerate mutase